MRMRSWEINLGAMLSVEQWIPMRFSQFSENIAKDSFIRRRVYLLFINLLDFRVHGLSEG